MINYKVRFKEKMWSSDLANPDSLLYRELEEEIQEMVIMHVAFICIYRSQGSINAMKVKYRNLLSRV